MTKSAQALGCVFLAFRVVRLLRIIMSVIGAEPDMRHYLALIDGGATGPKPTLGPLIGCKILVMLAD